MAKHSQRVEPVPFDPAQVAYLKHLAESHKRPSISETEREIWLREGKIALARRIEREQESIDSASLLNRKR
jgi:hypothetical protein